MRSFVAAHPLVLGSAAFIVIAVSAFVLLYFEPQALFINHRVDEPLPTVAIAQGSNSSGAEARGGKDEAGAKPEPAIQTLASGTFQSYEHSTTGRARIIRLTDGSRYLRLDGFETSNGPDVKVYLSAAAAGGPGDAFDDEYVELGGLKGNIGNQNYEIPAHLQLGQFESAVIWCKRFSVAFGAAPLG